MRAASALRPAAFSASILIFAAIERVVTPIAALSACDACGWPTACLAAASALILSRAALRRSCLRCLRAFRRFSRRRRRRLASAAPSSRPSCCEGSPDLVVLAEPRLDELFLWGEELEHEWWFSALLTVSSPSG